MDVLMQRIPLVCIFSLPTLSNVQWWSEIKKNPSPVCASPLFPLSGLNAANELKTTRLAPLSFLASSLSGSLPQWQQQHWSKSSNNKSSKATATIVKQQQQQIWDAVTRYSPSSEDKIMPMNVTSNRLIWVIFLVSQPLLTESEVVYLLVLFQNNLIIS